MSNKNDLKKALANYAARAAESLDHKIVYVVQLLFLLTPIVLVKRIYNIAIARQLFWMI